MIPMHPQYSKRRDLLRVALTAGISTAWPMRAVAQAAAALKDDPETYWPHVSGVTGFTTEEISWGWPEMEFPVRIVPDMLDVLEVEDVWVAKERNRTPRSREELARLIDASVVEEALASD